MKISYSDYVKKIDVSVLVAEVIFSQLRALYPSLKISEIADTTSGGTPLRSHADYYNGEIPWLKSGELNDGLISISEEYITHKGLQNSSAKLHPKGTLLLAMYGATAGKVGVTSIEAATNQAVCAIFPNDKVSQSYLFWFLRQHRYNFIEISKGGAQPNLSQSVINATDIPIPPKTIQQKISDLLSEIEKEGRLDLAIIPQKFQQKVNSVFYTKNIVTKLSLEQSHQVDLIKKLRQQILKDAMQGKLVPQDNNDTPAGQLLEKIKTEKEKLVREKKIKKEKPLPPTKPDEIPFEIPDSWVWCRLGEICFKITDGFHNTPPKVSKGYPYIAATHVKTEMIDWNNCHYVDEKYHKELYQKTYPQKGELLVVNIGAGCGTPAIIDVDFEFSFKNTAILKFNQGLVSSIFLKYYFVWKREEIYNQLTKGVLQPFLSLNILNNVYITFPPFNQQNRIVAAIDELMALCDSLEASVKANQQYTNMLYQTALKEALHP